MESYQSSVQLKAFGHGDDDDEKTRSKEARHLSVTRAIITTEDGRIEADAAMLYVHSDYVRAAVKSRGSFRAAADDVDGAIQIDLSEFTEPAIADFLKLLEPAGTADLDSAVKARAAGDTILSCLEISHFLQCLPLTTALAEFITPRVDKATAGSILMLSDRLGLRGLFEKCVHVMTESLDDLRDDVAWGSFDAELQNRLLTLRAAVSSSIVGRGSKVRRR